MWNRWIVLQHYFIFTDQSDACIHQVEEAAVVAGRADILQQLARFLSHDKETEGRRLDQRSQWTCMPDTETGPGCRAKRVAEQNSVIEL